MHFAYPGGATLAHEPPPGEAERPDEVYVLVHTAGLKIVLEWRTLDVWNACERQEMSLDECIDLVDDLRQELELYREHGVKKLGLPREHPDGGEDE